MVRGRRLVLAGLLGAALAWAAAAAALAQEAPVALSPEQEEEARAIEGLLMCPVCQGQTVRESESPVAQDIKLKIRQMLAEGKSRQEILAYFVNEWGEGILSQPPARGVGLIAWVAPVVLLALGAAVLVRFLRRQGATPAAAAEPASAEGELQRVEERLKDYL